MSDLTRLDIETKVALMAALVYDPQLWGTEAECITHAVKVARSLEKESHYQVTEQIIEKRKSVGG